MKWSLVRSLGNSKIVQSSFIWLFIVPIAARLLSNVDDVIDLTFFGGQISLTTSLPFSWQLLFGAACAFTIANIIYSAFCPEIFRKYKNFTDFKEHGKTILQVHSAMKSMVWCNTKPGVKTSFVGQLSSYFKNYCNQKEMNEKELDYSISQFDNLERGNTGSVTNNAFYFVQAVANIYNHVAIKLCLFFYLIGMSLISIIAYQNIMYVWQTFG